MPGRVLLPMRWLERHVHEHPGRLTWTAVMVLLASFAVLGWSIVRGAEAAHDSRVDTCIAINELSRKIYVTLGDFGTPVYVRAKFLPTTKCSTIP